MNSKALLILIIAILYILGAQWWYGVNHKDHCCDNNERTTTPVLPAKVEEKKEKDALMFKWSSAKANTYDKFATYKQNILNGNKDNSTLVITGKYFEGESTPSGFENMGIARAAEIRKLFPEVPDTRIQLLSQKVNPTDGVKDNEFTSASFAWEAATEDDKTLIEIGNKALIYFPFRSTNKEFDPTVDAYLKKLAERLKAGNEKVVITGHTDDRGEEAANMRLGERRSKAVGDILIKLGVPSDRISTLSKGETAPAEPNGTERGWRMNRRTEVEVVQ